MSDIKDTNSVAKGNAGFKYKFSIIMSVYKVEEFIEEAVDSLIEQDIGFEENVQVIMVDDGSPDNSGAICDRYKEKYPNNFVVIHKENGGLSSARNEGLRHIEGRYVNFFDPDDILTPNTLSLVYDFFDEKDSFIDMVAIPMYYFDAKEGQHPTNKGKFNKGNRVISLRKEHTLIHNSVASSFIKHDVAKNMRFDPDLCAMEDAKAIIEFMIFNPNYGVVSDCKYMYRQRTSGSVSLSHGAARRKNWYTDFLRRFSLSVINNCIEKIGYVPKFVQAVLLYDLHWKIEMERIPEGVLTEEEEAEFRDLFYSVYDHISDEMIMSSKFYYFEHKAMILSKKYKNQISVDLYNKDMLFSIRENTLRYFSNMSSTRIEQLKIEGNRLIVEANTFILPCLLDAVGQIEPQIIINDSEKIKCEFVDRNNSKFVLGECAFKNIAFKAEIELPELASGEEMRLELCVFPCGHNVKLSNFSFSDFAMVSNRYKNQYAFTDKYTIWMEDGGFTISAKTKKDVKRREKAFLRELWKSNGLGERKAVIARKLYRFMKHFKKGAIHIITDRMNKADDNGEAMLDFYNNNKKLIKANKIKYYYVIDKKCSDYKRIKNKHVIQVLGFKHKMYHLLADYVLSSHADDFVNKPMAETFECYRDLTFNQRFVFLQHGITQNDISGWLNRYNKNIFGFVTAARPESESILKYDYYYTKENVWEDGFARFDRLYNDEKRYITLMPTWRKYLTGGSDPLTGIWSLQPEFKNSDYYKFYNTLINNERLLSSCKKLGYTLCFMPHPNIIPHIKVFDKHEDVIFFGLNNSYREIYAKSNMILTDYSSAAFDFAYLRKPLAYMHFDYDEFFKGDHVAVPGYFDHERDGFGEVTYTVEETVNLIIEYMENGCALKDKYRERIDNFFAYNDKNNCQRIFNHIVGK